MNDKGVSIMDHPNVPDPNLYAQFRAKEIKIYTDSKPNLNDSHLHPDYREVMKWANDGVSCIMESFRQDHPDALGEHWFVALRAITGEDFSTKVEWFDYYWQPACK